MSLPFATRAQEIYQGQVIDSVTETLLPNITVKLANNLLAVQTNEQGHFSLSAKNSKGDTIIFSSVGYLTYRIPTSAFKSNMFIPLQPSNMELNEVVISGKKMKHLILERFSYKDLRRSQANIYDSPTSPFYLTTAFAKRFTAPKVNAILAGVELGRKDQVDYSTRPNKFTRFRINIMSVNIQTGAPDSIIFSKVVSLEDNSLKINVDLVKDHVILPSDAFFVAIEWFRIPYNEVVQHRYIHMTKGSQETFKINSYYRIIYQPILFGYSQSKKALSWIKINNVWQVYDHPDFEIALSATINY